MLWCPSVYLSLPDLMEQVIQIYWHIAIPIVRACMVDFDHSFLSTVVGDDGESIYSGYSLFHMPIRS